MDLMKRSFEINCMWVKIKSVSVKINYVILPCQLICLKMWKSEKSTLTIFFRKVGSIISLYHPDGLQIGAWTRKLWIYIIRLLKNIYLSPAGNTMMIISFKISDTLMSQWDGMCRRDSYKKLEKANVRIFYVEGPINSVNSSRWTNSFNFPRK